MNTFLELIRGDFLTSTILYFTSFLFFIVNFSFIFIITKLSKERIYSSIFLYDYSKKNNFFNELYLSSNKIKNHSSVALSFYVGYQYFINKIQNNLSYNSASLLNLTEKIMISEASKFFIYYHFYLKVLASSLLIIPFLIFFLFILQFYSFSFDNENILLTFHNAFFILLLGFFYFIIIFILFTISNLLLDYHEEKTKKFIDEFIIVLHKKFYIVEEKFKNENNT